MRVLLPLLKSSSGSGSTAEFEPEGGRDEVVAVVPLQQQLAQSQEPELAHRAPFSNRDCSNCASTTTAAGTAAAPASVAAVLEPDYFNLRRGEKVEYLPNSSPPPPRPSVGGAAAHQQHGPPKAPATRKRLAFASASSSNCINTTSSTKTNLLVAAATGFGAIERKRPRIHQPGAGEALYSPYSLATTTDEIVAQQEQQQNPFHLPVARLAANASSLSSTSTTMPPRAPEPPSAADEDYGGGLYHQHTRRSRVNGGNNNNSDDGDLDEPERELLENEPMLFENHRPAAPTTTLALGSGGFVVASSHHHAAAATAHTSGQGPRRGGTESNHLVNHYHHHHHPNNNNHNARSNPALNKTPAVLDPQEASFRQELKRRGLEIAEQEGDGNCLFRAVSLQVYGDATMHAEVRERCMDFMARDEVHFGQFVVDEPFQAYIARKRQLGVHGNNPEIQALSELFNRPVEVFAPDNGSQPLNIFHAEYKTGDAPIRLSYHDGNHYNAVIDPLMPTAGLGLGLPGLEPGLADKMQVAKAVAESDKVADEMELKRALKESHEDQLRRAIKESAYDDDYMFKSKAMALSDLDATNFELEQAMLAESMESYRRQEHGRKKRASPGGSRRRGRSGGASSPPLQTSELPVPTSVPWMSSSPALPIYSEYTSSVAAANPSPAASMPPAAASIPSAASASSSHHRSRRSSGGSTSSGSSAHHRSRSNSPSYAAAPSAATAALRSASPPMGAWMNMSAGDEYPQTVQELVMNGFTLAKVVHAYELIGDNFDDLLAFLMSTTAAQPANPSGR